MRKEWGATCRRSSSSQTSPSSGTSLPSPRPPTAAASAEAAALSHAAVAALYGMTAPKTTAGVEVVVLESDDEARPMVEIVDETMPSPAAPAALPPATPFVSPPPTWVRQPPMTWWVDPSLMVARAVDEHGLEVCTELSEGHAGFAVALDGKGNTLATSEISNLTLRAFRNAHKPVAPKRVLKRPAACVSVPEMAAPEQAVPPEPAEPPTPEPPAQAAQVDVGAPGLRCKAEYRRSLNVYSVRSKEAGRRQLFQIGGPSCPLGKAKLRRIADDCISRLSAGEAIVKVQEWARTRA